ncbi:hypothetical protein ACQKPE_17085 [Pseudomonas sp. NPDC089554]|uniref:hypothetical protein n=1 Tax=Pseudomonas sp. NPDC089554 TaxID=3390653 RepID=UPI003CFE0F3A
MDLHQNFVTFSRLDCVVAQRFKDRPLLSQSASGLLIEQWQARHFDSALDPLALWLVSLGPEGTSALPRLLPAVLIERYCRRTTLNLTPGEDFLSLNGNADPTSALDIDLHAVELLINECGPLLLKRYLEDLAEYWTSFDASGQTPWQWYAEFLQKQFVSALDSRSQEHGLTPTQIEVANHLRENTGIAQPNAQQPSIALLSTDLSASANIDVDLGSALLIEQAAHDDAPAVTLLYTLLGKLLAFPSRPTLLGILGRLWPHTRVPTAHQIHLVPLSDSWFQMQALQLLHQQILVAQAIADGFQQQDQAALLSQDLDRLTSVLELCDRSERTQRQRLSEHLPDWLRNAPVSGQQQYARMLIDTAQSYESASGSAWLDDVETAQAFANRMLAQRISADHPGTALLPEDVQVLNYQVTGVASGQGSLVISGEEHLVEYSLADLAIGNIGLIRPGRVELRSGTTAPLPTWMNETYMRTLVSELDVASAYPKMLNDKLLNDPLQKQRRQALLGTQLRYQLPALALELHLRGEGMDEQSVGRLQQVLAWPQPFDEDRWVMRALGILRRPDANPDRALNTWLFEALWPGAGTCLLYRPLHKQSLLQFDDRIALLTALATPGELQDDILQRLPEEERKVYAHGGFLEPHLFYPLDDPFAVPFGIPRPATLSVEPAEQDIGQAIYLACVQESIQRFQAHAHTTAQARWDSWKELGWLLFNTLLPLGGSTLGKVAWLVQMEVALAEFVETDSTHDPESHRTALINLLVDIALLLLSHTALEKPLEEGKEPALTQQVVSGAGALKPTPVQVTTTPPPGQLAFGWSAPTRSLSATQQSALQALSSTRLPSELGPPIPHGPLAGLFLADDQCWVQLQGKVYKVLLDEQNGQPRIIADTPQATPGPWLVRDEAGRWQLDLHLRLRGGMPTSSRIARMREEKRQRIQVLDEQIRQDHVQGMEALWRIKAQVEQFDNDVPDNDLKTQYESARAASAHWQSHLQRLKERNALEPLEKFKLRRATALCQHAYSEQLVQLVQLVTQRRYRPQQMQLEHFLTQFKGEAGRLKGDVRQYEGEISIDDLSIYKNRLAAQASLLDDMLLNAQAMYEIRQELTTLSIREPADLKQSAQALIEVLSDADTLAQLRYRRLDTNFNRLFALYAAAIDEPGSHFFWLNLANKTYHRVYSQRKQLGELAHPSQEMSVRLLNGIDDWLREANRQLLNFSAQLDDGQALEILAKVNEDLGLIQAEVRSELAQFPEFPPTISLKQLRQEAPGLIEVEDEGLLLGVLNADDATLVVVPDRDPHQPPRTFRQQDQAWVELPLPGTAPRQTKTKLKHLLKDSEQLMTRAQRELELERLQQHPNDNYLPVEIHELLMFQQADLLKNSQAIERHLTADNEVDESVGNRDAAQVNRRLVGLAAQLGQAAIDLRIQAALRQAPRMGEVQYLLDHRQVSVHALAPRTKLAKVKGRADDYLDEYVIRREGQDLWYAHFHYRKPETPRDQFSAGHLKTLAQRHAAGRVVVDPATGNEVQVYRAPITVASAVRYFFSD